MIDVGEGEAVGRGVGERELVEGMLASAAARAVGLSGSASTGREAELVASSALVAREPHRALVQGLLVAFERGRPAVGAVGGEDAQAHSFGHARALAGADAPQVAREVLALGRGLEAALEARGALDGAARQRVRLIADGAVGRALEAVMESRSRRRGEWLSCCCHELQSSLNTVANALWLLRSGDKPSSRVCDVADRATKKLEIVITDVRQADDRFTNEPPQRDNR